MPLAYSIAAALALLLRLSFGLPIFLPLAIAAFLPAWVLSIIKSRSNSARLAKMCIISFPEVLDVSILSLRDIISTPFSCNSEMMFSKSLKERPRRSNLYTTSMSPFRRYLIASANSKRAFRPLLCSEYTFSQPDFSNSDSCKSKF